MKFERYEWLAITIMISLFIFVGFIQGWSVSLVILNMCIISAIMTMGVNISPIVIIAEIMHIFKITKLTDHP